MTKLPGFRHSAAAIIASAGVFSTNVEACASDAFSSATLQAVGRAFAFVESAPRNRVYTVAVLYAADAADAEAKAAVAAEQLNKLPGPKRSEILAAPFRLSELSRSTEQIDALVIGPGLQNDVQEISDLIRKRHILSVGADRACLSDSACVLMVNADNKVEIVLNMHLAEAVGARFSSVFTMMVSRQ